MATLDGLPEWLREQVLVSATRLARRSPHLLTPTERSLREAAVKLLREEPSAEPKRHLRLVR